MTSIVIFAESAITAVKNIEACCRYIKSPFAHSFPENCCELISVHLGLLLSKANPHHKVQVVKAYNRSSDEWHFWVEVENIVVDLTAHQFEQYSSPLVCAKPSPLENAFPITERIPPREAKRAASFDINNEIETALAVFMS